MGLFRLDSDVPQLRRSRAIRLDPSASRRATRAVDRSCSHPGCGIHLSRYNPSPTCAEHGGWQDPPARGR